MNHIHKSVRSLRFRPLLLVPVLVAATALSATAAEFTYQYYRFKPTKIDNGGSQIQLSEFTFSRAGTLLNLNNRNGSGVGVIPVTVTSAGQGSTGGEDPPKVADGSTATKWFRNGALIDGNELIFTFGAGVTIDSYNFATANDSAGSSRTPVSWRLFGSNNGVDWTILDARTDAISTVANFTYQAGFPLPADVPPVINSFTAIPAIQINGTPVAIAYNSQFSTTRTLNDGTTNTDLPAETGTLNVTPSPSSTTSYTFTAAKPGSADAVRSANVRTVQGGTSTYRYVRYKITKRRGGTGSNLVQLSEFEFYNTAVSATKIPITTITNPGGSNTDPGGGEYVSKLVDGDNNTKWLDGNNRFVIFDFGSPVPFNRYSFVTGNDFDDRDPVNWTLEGSDDINATRWTLIENVNFDYPTLVARNAASGAIPLPGASIAPTIDVLTASTGAIIAGSSVTITYSTQAAATVTIDPAPGGTLPLFGSFTVSPTATTEYTVTASSADVNIPPAVATITVVVVPDPGGDEITYDDFATAGPEVNLNGSASITTPESAAPGRLRLTPETNSLTGAAWFVKKLTTTGGFEATFGLSMNKALEGTPADGTAFVIQNHPLGTSVSQYSETGVSQNALNISFRTFGDQAGSSRVEVRSGEGDNLQIHGSVVAYDQPGVQLYGVPGNEFTLASRATDPAYQIRVVYKPYDLDIYLDGVAILQNVTVDLGEIGAVDAQGKSYFGFTARTGGLSENNDITRWNVRLGDYSALPPFGLVKSLFKYAPGTANPISVDLVWNSSIEGTYNIFYSENLVDWSIVQGELFGQEGQSATRLSLLGDPGADPPVPAINVSPKGFFKVESITPSN